MALHWNIHLIFLILCSFYFSRGLTGFNTLKISPRPLWNATHTDQLRRDLLLNYDKFARPAQHYNTTTVRIGMVIRHIEVNEFKSSCTVYCWMKLNWNDEKLKWNSSQYGNLNMLHLADHEIWQPDIFLYNGATSTAVNHFGNTHALVADNGDIIWVPPAQFTALCSINLRFWPFDSQMCSFQFGSWTYNGEQVDLQMYNNNTEITLDQQYHLICPINKNRNSLEILTAKEISFSVNSPIRKDRIQIISHALKILLVENSEWEITSTSVERHLKYYECCLEPYPDITMNVSLSRISPSYKAIVVTPGVAVIFMTLMSFWLPPQSGEKIILQGCTSIIITMFLLYFTQKLPVMGNHTPLIVLFYSSSLYIVCFSLAASVAVIWISRTKHTYNLPWMIKQPLIGWLGKWLFLRHYISQASINSHRVTAEEMRDHQVTDMEDNNTNDDHQMIGNVSKVPIQQDWVLFAAAIDRFSFVFYSLVFLILSITHSL